VNELAALVLLPRTRERALELIERLSLRRQVEVMHELFHVHDHMRPWAPNFDLGVVSADARVGLKFYKGYRVFRGLAWRLWEGQRDVEEILSALRRESSEAGLDPAWEAALLEYCVNNVLSLHAHRAAGMAVVKPLAEAVRQSGHPSLVGTHQMLMNIEQMNRLDMRTLLDAAR
jgi:hypothetical protein